MVVHLEDGLICLTGGWHQLHLGRDKKKLILGFKVDFSPSYEMTVFLNFPLSFASYALAAVTIK